MDGFIGSVLMDRFRVDSFLAAGGMGAVFRVYDLERQTPLAMKVLNEDLAEDADGLFRFRREANALKNITHPNIVAFYGLYEAEGRYILLQEYVDGRSLKETIRDRGRPFPLRDALIYLNAMSAALHYAHAHEVVHCDVKPANVLVDQGGAIFLTDFGITRSADSTHTKLGLAGTPGYMAPEQCLDQPVSAQTDVYALGVVMYEMLAGRRPFTGGDEPTEAVAGTTAERMRYAHVHTAPPDPRDFNPALSEAVASVLLKALAKDPADRWDSARAFFETLCAAASTDPSAVPTRVAAVGEAPDALPPWHEPQPSVIAPPPGPAPIPVPPSPAAPAGPGLSPAVLFATGGAGIVLLVCLLIGAVVVVVLVMRQPAAPASSSAATPRPARTEAVSSARELELEQDAEVMIITATPDDEVEAPPTRTPRPATTERPRRDFEEYYPLEGCAKSRLQVGDRAHVAFGGGPNGVRSYPDTHPNNNTVGRAQEGEEMQIVGGPVCNYGWVLWEVVTETGLEGWTPEGDGSTYWLVPIE